MNICVISPPLFDKYERHYFTHRTRNITHNKKMAEAAEAKPVVEFTKVRRALLRRLFFVVVVSLVACFFFECGERGKEKVFSRRRSSF